MESGVIPNYHSWARAQTIAITQQNNLQGGGRIEKDLNLSFCLVTPNSWLWLACYEAVLMFCLELLANWFSNFDWIKNLNEVKLADSSPTVLRRVCRLHSQSARKNIRMKKSFSIYFIYLIPFYTIIFSFQFVYFFPVQFNNWYYDALNSSLLLFHFCYIYFKSWPFLSQKIVTRSEY